MVAQHSVKILKILIIAPAWIGDMVMSHSLIRFLKDQHAIKYPEMQSELIIDVLVPAHGQAIYQAMPEVSEILISPFKHGEFSWTARKQLGQSLKSKNYDEAIVLPNSWKSALVPYFAKIKIRTGYLGEGRFFLLNNFFKLTKARKKILPLMVQRFCVLGLLGLNKKSFKNLIKNNNSNFLLNSLPKPRLIIPSDWREESFKKFFQDLNQDKINSKKLVILCPGAEYGPAKKWPIEHYASLSTSLRLLGFDVWILGAAGDQKDGDEIALRTPGVINLAGKTSLKEAMVILDQAEHVITNDSGLMHIRAALDKSLVGLFGSTSPLFTPPLSNQAHILGIDLYCRPCFERICPKEGEGFMKCLRDLKPELVLESLGLK